MPSRKPMQSAALSGGIECSRPIELVCDRIVRDFERGVSLRSLGKMYQQPVLTLEGILRDRLRLLEASLRRAGVAAAATACLLVCVSISDVWEASQNDQAAISRAFRKTGRARKRGLEDSSCLIELRQGGEVAA